MLKKYNKTYNKTQKSCSLKKKENGKKKTQMAKKRSN